MKKVLALLVCVLLLGSTIAFPVAAQGEEEIEISRTVEDLGDGCYYIETITVPSIQPYSNTKTGTKRATYVVSEVAIYSVSVTGTFTYDGSHAEATSADGSCVTYVPDAVIDDCHAYTMGAYACASGTVIYMGSTLTKTVKLLCSRDGSLS